MAEYSVVLTAALVGALAASAALVVFRFLRLFRPTRVKVRVVEHRAEHLAESGDAVYVLLYEVLEPQDLAGRFGVTSTRRGDLIADADGGGVRGLAELHDDRAAGEQAPRVFLFRARVQEWGFPRNGDASEVAVLILPSLHRTACRIASGILLDRRGIIRDEQVRL
jgi:hypothetical protein